MERYKHHTCCITMCETWAALLKMLHMVNQERVIRKVKRGEDKIQIKIIDTPGRIVCESVGSKRGLKSTVTKATECQFCCRKLMNKFVEDSRHSVCFFTPISVASLYLDLGKLIIE